MVKKLTRSRVWVEGPVFEDFNDFTILDKDESEIYTFFDSEIESLNLERNFPL